MSGADLQWLDPRDQILKRPGYMIGSVDVQNSTEWIYTMLDDKPEGEIKQKDIAYVPGLLKIYNEVLDNARDASINDDTLTKISIDVSKETGLIVIENNGLGIKIDKYKDTGLYNPEVMFSKLNSGTNYDDSKERYTGGLNGLGVKLTNIFSSYFKVECADSSLKFSQEYENNLSLIRPVKVVNSKMSFVRISFKPDLTKFHLTSLTDDMIDLFRTYALYTSATVKNKVSVKFNGSLIKVKGFEKFMNLFLGSKSECYRVYFSEPKWNIGLSTSSSFKSMSFVNGIYTKEGGNHVKYITNQIVKALKEALEKKKELKDATIKNSFIEQNLFVFVNCLINKPDFSSQTKESLSTKSSNFGSSINIPDKFISDFIKNTDILETIVKITNVKQSTALVKLSCTTKKSSKLHHIKDLNDANLAGTKRSSECTLFLVEGQSAKAFVVSGISVIGSDLYGVFPLRGKLFNVRDAKAEKLTSNKEIEAIIEILNLKYETKESLNDIKNLRYGHVCFLTDADVDGSHIKALIMNFFEIFCPSLFKLNYFTSMSTYVLKATKKKNKDKVFLTIPQAEKWLSSLGSNHGWFVKYYKGLGTHKDTEAKELFKELPKYLVSYEPDDLWRSSLELAFGKDTNARKKWLLEYNHQVVEEFKPSITVSDFINKELILFSYSDNIRSIPSVIDGLKPSQRKIIWLSCNIPGFTNEDKQMKVISLTGKLIEKMEYHHGPDSASGAIINMAQGFSNNLNLLMPEGQFGTRIHGGADASNPRYLFTYLNPMTRVLLDPLDDPLLKLKRGEEQDFIEPEYFVPLLPIVLINGASGIGTGYSTDVPRYNISDIKENLINLIQGKELKPMIPWYRGFKGTIKEKKPGVFETYGCYIKSGKSIKITELPVDRWTSSYKEFLTEKEDEGILTFTPNESDTNIDFTIRLNEDIPDDEIYKKLNLVSKSSQEMLSTNNMYLFNSENKLTKYSSPLDILKEFYTVRMKFYLLRKNYLINKYESECLILNDKIRFIKLVIEEKVVIFKKPKLEIIEQLKLNQFSLDVIPDLLDLRISSFCSEKIIELINACKTKKALLESIKSKSIEQMYLNDLDKIKIE